MITIVLTDLDGVHIQPPRECPPGVELTVGAVNKNGEPSSYSTPKQLAFLNFLLTAGMVVPVTARETASFKRVKLPFHGYAICSFGGVILTGEGTPEPRWHEHISREAGLEKGNLASLKGLVEEASIRLSIDVRATIVKDAGNDLYLNCKHNHGDVEQLSQIASLLKAALPNGWTMHFNGNNLAAMPPFLGKDKAVVFFLKELAPPYISVVGLGDSLSDLCFMELCDYVVCPGRSQIAEMLSRANSNDANVTAGVRI